MICMYKHIKLLVLVTIPLLFSACTTPAALQYDNKNLNLILKQKRIQVPGTQIKSNRENFGILFLNQKLLRLNDSSLVMYETAKTDMQYMFQPITPRIISVVFDAVNIVKVYEKDSLYAYQLILKDHRILNIIVTQGYVDELQMVYGMSSKQFVKTLKRLNANINSVPYPNAIELKYEQDPLISRWTTWKINFYPLVVPLPRFIGF